MVNRVQLPGTDIEASRLAFGCASILGRIGARDADRALHAAFDAGITHFDLARSYGFGEAERFFGAFVKDKRDKVTIATKFGINPSRAAGRLAPLKPLVRSFIGAVPALHRLARARSRSLTRTGVFTLAEAQRSVETSLAQLGVDCIDLLLMHDCEVDGFVPDEMASFSDRLRREGKIRAFGIATSIDAVLGIVGHDYDFVRCLQFPNNLIAQNLRRIPAPERFGIITHSPFRSFDHTGDAPRRNWTEILRAAGFDARDKSLLAALQLAWALHDNADGIVLCSAFDPKHLAENIAVAERGGFAADLLSQLSEGKPKEATSAPSGPKPGAQASCSV